MNHLVWEEKSTYKVALLTKSLNKTDLEKYYPTSIDTIAISIDWDSPKKCSAAHASKVLDTVLRMCMHLQVQYIYCTDGTYFKALTKVKKVEPYYGSLMPCAVIGYTHIQCILSINYQALIYSPKQQSKLDLANQLLVNPTNTLGSGIIHYQDFPSTYKAIQEWLQKLLECPILTCDIETYGLALVDADIGSIAFAWSQHEGIAFLVDESIKPLLKGFFISYTGTLIFHNATFDIRNIIYRCFMTHHTDTSNLLIGLHAMYRSIHDTKIISYLATNSTEGNSLSLKVLALEYAGNYGLLEEDADITKYTTKELLNYNLIDVLSTWYVFNKYMPVMIQDQQEDIYNNIMLPSLKTITQMEIVGMPLAIDKLDSTAEYLMGLEADWYRELRTNPIVKKFERVLQRDAFIAKNTELKKKFIPINEFRVPLNINSGPQLQKLLYTYMGLPVIELTDNKAPSVAGETLEKLLTGLINAYQITEGELDG
jgi:DNA polymerase-1